MNTDQPGKSRIAKVRTIGDKTQAGYISKPDTPEIFQRTVTVDVSEMTDWEKRMLKTTLDGVERAAKNRAWYKGMGKAVSKNIKEYMDHRQGQE